MPPELCFFGFLAGTALWFAAAFVYYTVRGDKVRENIK